MLAWEGGMPGGASGCATAAPNPAEAAVSSRTDRAQESFKCFFSWRSSRLGRLNGPPERPPSDGRNMPSQLGDFKPILDGFVLFLWDCCEQVAPDRPAGGAAP